MPAATAFLQATNRASSLVIAPGVDGITDPVAVNVTAATGALFPAVFPFHITIDAEILSCTNRVGDVLTCARAQEGTVIAVHAIGASVQLRVTAGIITQLQTAVNNCETVGAFTNEAEGITALWTWTLAAGSHIARRIAGDIADRSYWADDRIAWGTGGAGADTEIGRGGANLLSTPDDFALGALPATAGSIRLTNATYIYSRNAANTADIRIIGLNGANLIDHYAGVQQVLFGGATLAFESYVTGEANPKTRISHGQIQFGPGAAAAVDTTVARQAAAVIRITTNLEIGGASPATAGALRLPNATYIEARNFAGAADIILLGLNASNEITMNARVRNTIAGAGVVLDGYVGVEANPRVCISSDSVRFGPGGAGALDTTMQRTAPGLISFVGGGFVCGTVFIEEMMNAISDELIIGIGTARLRLPRTAADPGGLNNADIWYNTTGNELKARINGVTTVLGQSNVPGSSPSAAHLFEEFCGGYTSNSASAIVGELGWNSWFSGTGSITAVEAIANHPGIMRLNATATGFVGGIKLGSSSRHVLYSTDYFDVTLMVRFNGAAGTNVFKTGLTYDDGITSSNALWLERQAGDANFFMTSRSGGVDRTRTNTGIAIDGLWHKVRIRRVDAANIGFTFDAAAEVLHNVSIPVCAFQVSHLLTSTAAVSYDIDYMDLYITGLTR